MRSQKSEEFYHRDHRGHRENGFDLVFQNLSIANKGDGAVDKNFISGEIVDAALKVHRKLGPGLPESAYEACLVYELTKVAWRPDLRWTCPSSTGV